MRPTIPVLLALCCVGALAAIVPPSPEPQEPPAASLPLRSGSGSCKPMAPLRLTLSPPDDGAGSFELAYSVTPLVDVLDLEVELRLPRGGAVASHAAVRAGSTEAGQEHSGSARIAAPAGPGFVVEVVAKARVADPVITGGIATLCVTELLEFGEVARDTPGRLLLTSSPVGDEAFVSRDFAAVHRPVDSAGAGR
ncbi:hypothetical protein [Engelhardtia mirabilis]|uniref:Uncharacterized protein n=1 Tax=Engelhardtia mirabilis TaxID=2528011 RepID=A0A518BSM9_9BACT|nr:hypothetical protein Pla133_51040 [Planctomycetes bacterium Pla133]QDV04306.1 hypothetical protein Pla86_51010 [Planctomycetes bacterium Pla86]